MSAPRTVLTTTGYVKWFNVHRGFGFIERDDNEEDIFVHVSNIKIKAQNNSWSLEKGEPVEFEVRRRKKGIEAMNVTGVNGNPPFGNRSIYKNFDGLVFHPRKRLFKERDENPAS